MGCHMLKLRLVLDTDVLLLQQLMIMLKRQRYEPMPALWSPTAMSLLRLIGLFWELVIGFC